MTEIKDYIRVYAVAEALAALQDTGAPTRLLAGGTDLFLKLRVTDSEAVVVVDISDVAELNGIHENGFGVRIGAATKLADVARSDAMTGALKALADGAGLVGSPQIRNLATIGGNLCNAAPSADTAAPLLALDAVAEIASPSGKRSLPLKDFFTGPGQTALKKGEMLLSILIPKQPDGAVSVYLKQSPRRAMDLAVVGVAVLAAHTNGKLEARLALGAVAPTPIRVPEAEKLLNQTAKINDQVINEAARLAVRATRPISDVRASAEYRLDMIKNLTARALKQVLYR